MIVLFVGGMCGVGKTTAATRVARRNDLWLYPIDSRMLAHAEVLESASHESTVDELWLERSPQQMADDFELDARRRFQLVLDEIRALPDDGAPVLVEGSLLVPELLGEAGLFVVADPTLSGEMLRRRGSLTFARTRDPEQAHANRVRRDVMLGERLRAAAPKHLVIEIGDVAETEAIVEQFVRTRASAWLERPDRGDVALRRRAANDRWLDQWRRYAAIEPDAQSAINTFGCECDRPGCMQQVAVPFGAPARPLLAH